MGAGGRKIAKATGVSRSTAYKYQELTAELRDKKREQAIDRSYQIIEMADQEIAKKIMLTTAKEAAVIGKIQSDRLLDLQDPNRMASTTNVGVFNLSDEQAKRLLED
jgi:ACT domain-containing protein